MCTSFLVRLTKSKQGPFYFEFPCFSCSNTNFPSANFSYFEDTSYAKLTWPTHSVLKKKYEISQQLSQYPWYLESGNLGLNHTKFLCVLTKFPVLFCHFPRFPCAVGTLLHDNLMKSPKTSVKIKVHEPHNYPFRVVREPFRSVGGQGECLDSGQTMTHWGLLTKEGCLSSPPPPPPHTHTPRHVWSPND